MAVAQSEPSSAAASLTGLARALMQAGRLPTSVLQAAQRQSSLDKSPFIEVLLKSGHISSSELAGFCSEAFGFPVFDLREFDLSTRPEKLVDTKLMLRLRALPLSQRGNRVAVAISDPTQVQSLDQIQFQTASTVEPVIVQHDALMQILDGLGRSTEQSLNDMVDDSFDVDLLSDDTQSTSEADTSEIDDAPVVRFLQKILLDAINVGASDIHFEPFEKFYRIRLRVDGELIEHAQPPVAIKEKLSARIKVLSRLDISEKRVPQDGRMKLALSPTRAIDFRVSTLPTLFGENLSCVSWMPLRLNSVLMRSVMNLTNARLCSMPSSGLMAWCWLRGRPVPAKQCRCIPASIFSTNPASISPRLKIRLKSTCRA
jgi:type IV pilus assembly protein PilB